MQRKAGFPVGICRIIQGHDLFAGGLVPFRGLGWFKRRIPGCLVDRVGVRKFSRGGPVAPFLASVVQQSSVDTPADVFAMAAVIAWRTRSAIMR